jgi:hypothetical protein
MTGEQNETIDDGYLTNLNGAAWGMTLGVFMGLGLFTVTAFLTVKGGANVGDLLGRLSQFLPYYDVDWRGAFLGLIYFFVLGNLIGRLVCAIYNRAAAR